MARFGRTSDIRESSHFEGNLKGKSKSSLKEERRASERFRSFSLEITGEFSSESKLVENLTNPNS